MSSWRPRTASHAPGRRRPLQDDRNSYVRAPMSGVRTRVNVVGKCTPTAHSSRSALRGKRRERCGSPPFSSMARDTRPMYPSRTRATLSLCQTDDVTTEPLWSKASRVGGRYGLTAGAISERPLRLKARPTSFSLAAEPFVLDEGDSGWRRELIKHARMRGSHRPCALVGAAR